MPQINLTRCWSPLVDLRGNWQLNPRILLFYRKRAPGEQRPFQFAVARETDKGIGPARLATKCEIRIALARMANAGLIGTIAAELAFQCGARIEHYPLRQKRIYGPDRLSQTAVYTVSDPQENAEKTKVFP